MDHMCHRIPRLATSGGRPGDMDPALLPRRCGGVGGRSSPLWVVPAPRLRPISGGGLPSASRASSGRYQVEPAPGNGAAPARSWPGAGCRPHHMGNVTRSAPTGNDHHRRRAQPLVGDRRSPDVVRLLGLGRSQTHSPRRNRGGAHTTNLRRCHATWLRARLAPIGHDLIPRAKGALRDTVWHSP